MAPWACDGSVFCDFSVILADDRKEGVYLFNGIVSSIDLLNGMQCLVFATGLFFTLVPCLVQTFFFGDQLAMICLYVLLFF